MAPDDHGRPQGASGGEYSNTPPANPRIVASGVDTLYLGYLEHLDPDWVRRLDEMRQAFLAADEQARVAWAELPTKLIDIGGSPFQFAPGGGKGFRYRLHNADMNMNLSPASQQGTPRLIAQLRAEFLWHLGWEEAAWFASAMAGILQGKMEGPENPLVSRADLCVDFQGWIPVLGDLDRFVCRAKHRAIYREGRRLTGFSFGRGAIVARLYDKSHEVTKSGKVGFHAIWKEGGYDPSQPVWRLEFQLKRVPRPEMMTHPIA